MAEDTQTPADTAPFSREIVLEMIPKNRDYKFNEAPNPAEVEAIKVDLDLRGLRKLRFEGVLTPLGKDGWTLDATLGASVTQECVITTEPVKTRIDTQVYVRFVPESQIPEDRPETELDEEIEPLGKSIDLGLVMLEALVLAIPEYPRAEGVQMEPVSTAPPGEDPLTEETIKPFAGLAGLKEKLEKSGK